jgi:hypothetical protein
MHVCVLSEHSILILLSFSMFHSKVSSMARIFFYHIEADYLQILSSRQNLSHKIQIHNLIYLLQSWELNQGPQHPPLSYILSRGLYSRTPCGWMWWLDCPTGTSVTWSQNPDTLICFSFLLSLSLSAMPLFSFLSIYQWFPSAFRAKHHFIQGPLFTGLWLLLQLLCG